jgi:hypothetical protein
VSTGSLQRGARAYLRLPHLFLLAAAVCKSGYAVQCCPDGRGICVRCGGGLCNRGERRASRHCADLLRLLHCCLLSQAAVGLDNLLIQVWCFSSPQNLLTEVVSHVLGEYLVRCSPVLQTALCQHFKVDRYPTMLWGEPARFAANLQSGGDSRAGLEAVEVARSAEAVVAWINAQTQQ